MLQLTRTILAQIADAAATSGDEECCGFLFGLDHSHHRTATAMLEATNTASDRKKNFLISPQAYIKAEEFAIENQLCLLGVYHSHPNAKAIPSEKDRLAALPNFSYLIVSVMNGKMNDIRSWKLDSDFQLTEETLSFINFNYPIHGNCNYSNTAA